MCCLLVYCRSLAIAYGPCGTASSTWRLLSGKKKKKKKKKKTVRTRCAAYDPSYDHLLAHHCCFASYAYGMGVTPSLSMVMSLRRTTAALWRAHPEQLEYIAAKEQMTADEYANQIAGSYWGGVSDVLLLAKASGKELVIQDALGRTLAATSKAAETSRRSVKMQWHDQHYVVPTAIGAGPRSSRRYSRLMRCVDRYISRQTAATDPHRGQPEPNGDVRGGMMDMQRQSIEQQVQQRNQYSSEYPELIQRRGAHHRCLVCRQWATSSHIATTAHWHRLLEWEAQDPSIQIQMLRMAEQHECKLLGPARGAPRVPCSNTDTQQPPSSPSSAALDVEISGEIICLLCEAPTQAGHNDSAEHQYNLQSWQHMTPLGKSKYLQQATARWRARIQQARGGMLTQSSSARSSSDMQATEDSHLALEEEPTDHELAIALQASIYEEQGGPGLECDGLWAVLCQSSTREYTIRCRLESRIRDIQVAVAIATKTPSTEVLLATEGRVPHSDTLLSMLDPPYCFDIVRRSPFPGSDRSARPSKRGRISVDLGILEDVHGGSMAEDQQRYTGQEGSHSSSATACVSGDSCGDMPPPIEPSIRRHAPSPIEEREMLGREDERAKESEERQSMESHDQNVRAIRINRPRDELACQYYEPLTAHDLVEQLAKSKKMKRQGFTLYQPVDSADTIQAEGTYYLTWTKERRGGVCESGRTGSSDPHRTDMQIQEDVVSKTLTYHASDSATCLSDSMHEAKHALTYLEEVVMRARVATWYLEQMTMRSKPPRIVNLSELTPPVCRQCRGGMWRRSEHQEKEQTGPARWETRQQVQGLQVHSRIQAGQVDLPCLGAEDFATDAHGFALLAWENWVKNHALRSRKGFLAILPGNKQQQAAAILGEDQGRVVLKELVLQVPDASRTDGGRRFAKIVTVVNHTVDPTTPAYEVKHRSQEVQLTMAHEHLIFLDLFSDMCHVTP